MILRFIIKLTEDIVALFIALVFLKIAFKVTMGIDVLGDRSPKHRAKNWHNVHLYWQFYRQFHKSKMRLGTYKKLIKNTNTA